MPAEAQAQERAPSPYARNDHGIVLFGARLSSSTGTFSKDGGARQASSAHLTVIRVLVERPLRPAACAFEARNGSENTSVEQTSAHELALGGGVISSLVSCQL